jgi:uncharacterized FlaG/YvyC family protein
MASNISNITTTTQASTAFNAAVRIGLPDFERRNANSAQKRQAAVKQFVADMPGMDAGRKASEDLEEIRKIAAESAAKLNTASFNKKLQFVVDSKSNDITVQVRDSETNQVIRVLPPEELRSINNGLKGTEGMIVNKMA